MAVMDLMNLCHQALPPETICDAYNKAHPGSGKSATKNPAVLKALWDNCGHATIEVIAAGAVTLATIWQAASGASRSTGWLTKTCDGNKDLLRIYEDVNFLSFPACAIPRPSRSTRLRRPHQSPPPPAAKTPAKKNTRKNAEKVPAKKGARKVGQLPAKRGPKKGTRKS